MEDLQNHFFIINTFLKRLVHHKIIFLIVLLKIALFVNKYSNWVYACSLLCL